MFFIYEQRDKPTIDLKTKYKVVLYFYILGVTIVLKKIAQPLQSFDVFV